VQNLQARVTVIDAMWLRETSDEDRLGGAGRSRTPIASGCVRWA